MADRKYELVQATIELAGGKARLSTTIQVECQDDALSILRLLMQGQLECVTLPVRLAPEEAAERPLQQEPVEEVKRLGQRSERLDGTELPGGAPPAGELKKRPRHTKAPDRTDQMEELGMSGKNPTLGEANEAARRAEEAAEARTRETLPAPPTAEAAKSAVQQAEPPKLPAPKLTPIDAFLADAADVVSLDEAVDCWQKHREVLKGLPATERSRAWKAIGERAGACLGTSPQEAQGRIKSRIAELDQAGIKRLASAQETQPAKASSGSTEAEKPAQALRAQSEAPAPSMVPEKDAGGNGHAEPIPETVLGAQNMVELLRAVKRAKLGTDAETVRAWCEARMAEIPVLKVAAPEIVRQKLVNATNLLKQMLDA